jgi:sugar-specific transcriptional regulator TrmB
MYEKELENLGLSEKETKVYLASLELGAETVQNISKKSGINRATTYVQIELLKAKGLMSEFEKGKKTFYIAESPSRLSRLLNVYEKDLELKKAEVARILPFLNDIFAGAGEKPKVRFFEGMEGARAMQDDFLAVEDKKIQSFTNPDKLFELLPKHEEDYTKRRIEQGIQTEVIYTRKDGPIENANDASKLRTTKFVSPEKFPMAADVTIFGNKVAIVTYKAKPIGVVIEDKEIADTMRSIFYLIWESVK